MGSYRKLFVFLTLVAALLAAPAMSTARTTPPGRSSAPAPSMPPTTAASPGRWIPANAPSPDDGTTGPGQGAVTTQKDFIYIAPDLSWLFDYDTDTPSSATAGVSPAGTAAALSVAGVMAMMLL